MKKQTLQIKSIPKRLYPAEIILSYFAPYLPYRVGYYSHFDCGIKTLTPDSLLMVLESATTTTPSYDKLVLRPLSDLTKEIEHNGERFMPQHKLLSVFYEKSEEINDADRDRLRYEFETMAENIGGRTSIENLPFWCVQKLIEWHFDVFDLIEMNLAIDINSLKS